MSDKQFVDYHGNPLRVGDRVALAGANRRAFIVGVVEALGTWNNAMRRASVATIRTDSGRVIRRYGSSNAINCLCRVLTPEFAKRAADDADAAVLLDYLEAAGVDNWDGYSEARRMKREAEGEGNE